MKRTQKPKGNQNRPPPPSTVLSTFQAAASAAESVTTATQATNEDEVVREGWQKKAKPAPAMVLDQDINGFRATGGNRRGEGKKKGKKVRIQHQAKGPFSSIHIRIRTLISLFGTRSRPTILTTRTTTMNTNTGNAKSVKNEEWKNFESERTASALASQAPPSTAVTSTVTMDEDEIGKLVSVAILFFVPSSLSTSTIPFS